MSNTVDFPVRKIISILSAIKGGRGVGGIDLGIGQAGTDQAGRITLNSQFAGSAEVDNGQTGTPQGNTALGDIVVDHRA